MVGVQCDHRSVFFFKQKTAYEMRISDWSSDVCSSDLGLINPHDIMFYDATGEQAKHRTHPDILGPLRREPGDPIYEVDNKFDLPESFYKDDLSTKPEAHSAIVRLNHLFYGPMPPDDEASWHRFNNYYYT